jgi:hypothetical protein
MWVSSLVTAVIDQSGFEGVDVIGIVNGFLEKSIYSEPGRSAQYAALFARESPVHCD